MELKKVNADALHGEGFKEMEEAGRRREVWFRRFLELPNGIPDADTFRRVFEQINPAELIKCLQAWLYEKSESGGRRIGIDGKTIGAAGSPEGIRLSTW